MQPTKNKLFLLILTIFLAGGVFLAGFNLAQAVGDAYFPEDTTVAMDNGDFTIKANSDADEVTTNATTVTVKITGGQSFTFKSPGRKVLGVVGEYLSKSCNATESSLVIAPVTGTAQATVTITPGSGTCTDTSAPAGSGSSSGGGGGGGGGGTTTVASPTPTPSVSATPTPSATPTASPVATPVPVSPVATKKLLPASIGFVSLSKLSLKDGDIISAAGSSDPDVYIVNSHGYKRLFLNPAIFNFYGHLGGFSKVKKAAAATRDTFVTSGLFRNCETNDKKVYGVETTGEDTGILHWVNTSGDQAVQDDPDFFKKVFCINTKEFSWYKQGVAYTSVNQIPDYTRKNISSVSVSTPTPIPTASKKYKVFDTTSLNVRASASTSGAILGKLPEGQTIESLGTNGLWHKIKYQNKDGWVHGDYLKAI